jgi:hypothetical protein
MGKIASTTWSMSGGCGLIRARMWKTAGALASRVHSRGAPGGFGALSVARGDTYED